MTTLIFRAGENPTQCSQIPLGIRAENEVTQVALDFSAWAEEFGAGVVQLLVRRDGDSSPYPVVLTQSGTTATWTVSATDLAKNGPLQAEFIYTVGTLVKKSEVLRFYVLRDIGTPGSAPDPYETWLETLTELAAQTQQDAAAAAGDAADAAAASQAIQDMSVQADTLEPGSYATVDKIVDPDTGAVTLVFGIPRGQDGSGGGDSLWEAGTGIDAIVAKTASDPNNPNTASGKFAVAAGFLSVASGQSAFAIGNQTNGVPTTASGESSFAQGKGCTASGSASQAMGQKNEAIGHLSHAIGTYCQAKGLASAAFGGYCIASGRCSFVAGQYNEEDTNADLSGTGSKRYILIIGNGTADNARSNAMTVDWNGNEVLAGKLTLGAGPTEDMDAATKQYVDGQAFWEAGTGATAITAKNPDHPNVASGAGAIAAGAGATASGVCSFAFGSLSRSYGSPEASGAASFAFGLASKASGNYSIAFGQVPEAKAVAALAFGDHVIASGRASLVAGRYNVEDENAVDASHGAGARKYLLIIGNGTADDARSNAMTVDWDGNEVLAGKLTLGAGPTEDMDAATKQYADRALPKAGGTMSGAIAMGSNKITGLANAENDGDAVNLGQVSGLISTNTAYFRGSFATKSALTAVAWQTSDPAAANYVTNNDYAVVLDDESQSDECWRYVYVAGTGWQAQYRINESPLTTAQLAALNSGATAQNISSIAEKYVKPSGGIPAADLAPGVIPTVPTNVSAFNNDAGYLTLASLPVYNGGVS